jgi:hypothetical protein
MMARTKVLPKHLKKRIISFSSSRFRQNNNNPVAQINFCLVYSSYDGGAAAAPPASPAPAAAFAAASASSFAMSFLF